MRHYYLTEKVTLIPDMFFTEKGGEQALRELHRLDNTDTIREYHVKSLHAHLVYALPNKITQTVPDKEIYPFILHLTELLNNQSEYNKIIFHYAAARSLAHVLISKGDRLQLANVYPVENFESAVYFLALAIKQTIVNPQLTKLYASGELKESEKQILENYFQEVQIHPISSAITLL